MLLARNATASQSPNHERHPPEQTLLYQLVQKHYPVFNASLEDQGQSLPLYTQQEFEAFLECGRLEYGFLRVRCEGCHTMSGWLPLVAKNEAFAPAVVPAGWQKVPRCWWMKCFLKCPFGNGY